MDTYHILNFHEIFAENAFCLSKRLGIELVKDFKPEKDHTYIIFGAHNQAATLHSIQVDGSVGSLLAWVSCESMYEYKSESLKVLCCLLDWFPSGCHEAA